MDNSCPPKCIPHLIFFPRNHRTRAWVLHAVCGQNSKLISYPNKLKSPDKLSYPDNCERSELPSLFNARIFYIFIYIYIYIFQAVRRAVNEMFETPDTVFNNLELLVNPSSTAKKCSATEDCCRNPGGDRHPSSTVKYCSATGLLPNRQRGERPGVNGLPFSHRRKETPVFNKLQLLVNRRLRQNRRKRNKPVFNS